MSLPNIESLESRVFLSVSPGAVVHPSASTVPALQADLNNGPDGENVDGGPQDSQPDSGTNDGETSNSATDTDTVQSGTGQDTTAPGAATPMRSASLGRFAPAATSTGVDLAITSVTSKLPGSVLAGSKAAAPVNVTLSNAGGQSAKGTVRIDLFLSPTANTIPTGATALSSTTKSINLKAGGSKSFALPKFTFPTGLNGKFFLVAKVTPVSGITETNTANDVGSSASAITIAPGFVDIQNLFTGPVPSTLTRGKHASITVPLKNLGNLTATGTATITVTASHTAGSTGTLLGTVNVPLKLKPGQTHSAKVNFTVPTTLAAGTYFAVVNATFPGDTNAANNIASSTGTFTVA